MLQRKNQIGRTMVEMLAVLAIIGVLTVGAIAGLSQATEKFRVNKTHDDILAISQGVVDLYSWSRKYPRLESSVLCKNGIFPDGCSNNIGRNPYGGKYIVESNVNDGVDAETYISITLDGLPASACNALADEEMDWGDFLMDAAEGKSNPTCSDAGNDGYKFKITFY